MKNTVRDHWTTGGPYEGYIGRWSRPVARAFLAWLDMPPGLRWLDVGCGTGALTDAILKTCRPARMIGVEPSEGFLAEARAHIGDKAAFHVGNATALPVKDASWDVVVSGLVLNFVPEPAAGLAEMKRSAAEGGTIAAYVWDYAQRMEMLRHFWDVAVELNPAAQSLDEAVRFPMCDPKALAKLFEGADLADVDAIPIEIATRFRDFDDYWNPFLGGQGPAPSYAMSLDEPSRAQLRDCVRKRLPVQADGSIPLVARAWAVRGRMPK